MVEEKPAAGKAPAKSKDEQTPSPPAAEKAAKKRTADEAGLPAEEPAAKAAASAEAAAEDYSKMTVAQLKEKLKERGVTDLSGKEKKADLVERLSRKA